VAKKKKLHNINVLFLKAFHTPNIFYMVGVSTWHYVFIRNGIDLNIDCFFFMKKIAYRVTY
jgi:hypothetical protein